jgi:MFS family permease
MFKGWWIVTTHFTVQFFVSGFFIYSVPLLFEPVIEAFDTDRTTVNYLPSLASLLGLVVSPIAGPLVDRWSARGLMLIGVASLVAGLLVLSTATDIRVFVAAGALLFSMAQGLLGPMTGSAVVSRWFTASRGRALGFAAIGTSAGGILMPFALGYALPDVGWRVALQGLAALVAVVSFPLVLTRFWDHPEELGLAPEPAATGRSAAPNNEGLAPMTSGQLLRLPSFWLFTLALGLFLACYTASLANLGQFGGDLGLASTQIPRLIMTLSACGIVGKLGFGYLADRAPLRLLLWIVIAFTAVALGVFSLAPGLSLLLVGCGLLGIASGGILPVWNAMVPQLFGLANFGRAMGLMAPVMGLVITPAYPVLGFIRDSAGSYVPAFQGAIGILVIAALFLVPLRTESVEAAG